MNYEHEVRNKQAIGDNRYTTNADIGANMTVTTWQFFLFKSIHNAIIHCTACCQALNFFPPSMFYPRMGVHIARICA